MSKKPAWKAANNLSAYGSHRPWPGIVKDKTPIAEFARFNDALRAVACVNACEGINPEAVPEMLEALKEVIRLISGGRFHDPEERSKVWDLVDIAVKKAEEK